MKKDSRAEKAPHKIDVREGGKILMTITAQFKTIISNFSLGLLSFCLFQRIKPQDFSAMNKVIVGEDGLYCVPKGKEVPAEAGNFYEVGYAGGSPDFNLRRANMEFAKMLLRNLTLDSYEALFQYCEDTKQLAKMQAQPWYRFARIVRNSLTHTQHWRFNSRDLSQLPVTWKDKTIDASMDGQELSFDFYDWWDGCELYNEMLAFSETLD